MKCAKCKLEAIDNESLCKNCKSKRNLRRKLRRDAGICQNCSNKLDEQNKTLCAFHKQKKREQQKIKNLKLIKAELCIKCKKPSITKICTSCREDKKLYFSKRHKQNICKYCNKIRLNNSTYCEFHKNYSRQYVQNLRKQVYEAYGDKCACCGENHLAFLSIDHVNNDGNIDRSNGIRGLQLIRKIIKEKFPDKYQILCFNCNTAKHFWPGGCPHKHK